MTGFPPRWRTPSGELYKTEKLWPNCTALAQAYGKDTQRDHVVVWVNSFGGTRVFGTSLGHHNETMNNDVWLGLVARGALWAPASWARMDFRSPPMRGVGSSQS